MKERHLLVQFFEIGEQIKGHQRHKDQFDHHADEMGSPPRYPEQPFIEFRPVMRGQLIHFTLDALIEAGNECYRAH